MTSRATIVDVRSVLAAGEALIEYFVGPERLTAFVVSADTFGVVEADVGSESVASRVRLARELLASPGNADRRGPVLEGLHELLLRPLEDRGFLDGLQRLVVVPHDALTYLPLGALRDPLTQGYVVEGLELAYASSAASLAALRRRPARDDAPRQGHAFAPFPDELPASVVEAGVVEAQLGARRVVGRRATEAAFRAALAGGGIVHAATHGVMNPLNPMFSRIELADGGAGFEDDGRLEVHELQALHITAPLVFLSGCETGVGSTWATDYVRGEDYATLARTFLLAGAGSVVASLWRLEDPAAAEFARRFYEHLDDASPVEALASAQRDMLSDPRYGDPFYWAPYQVAAG